MYPLVETLRDERFIISASNLEAQFYLIYEAELIIERVCVFCTFIVTAS